MMMRIMDQASESIDKVALEKIFTMQDVAISMLIRSIRYDDIVKSKFVGVLHRQMKNINNHLMNFGGFFCFVLHTHDDKYITFEYSEKLKKFTSVDASNKVLKILEEYLTEETGILAIDDILKCNNIEEMPEAQETYKQLYELSGISENRTFKYCKPHQTVWTSSAVKIENKEFRH